MSVPQFEFHADIAEPVTLGFYSNCGKRACDILLIVLAAPVVLPLLAVILAVTALTGGAPLYSQMRVGRNGQVFRCWKIRTMIPDADAALPRMLRDDPDLAEEWGRTQKLARDPRVTWLGVLLRRSSLDELPQLWNVLCGAMSLVGPRPFLPAQVPLYLGGRRDAEYYRMRPGITGLWQVCRRNTGSFSERAVFDAEYSERLGFRTDMLILFRTASVVLRATGT